MIHVFEIDESTICDYRNSEHREMAKKHCPDLFEKLNIVRGLPSANDPESLSAIYNICQTLGFYSAYEDENFNEHISIEVWHRSCLTYVKSFDWTKKRS